jgi:hypothetical protein
VRPLAYEKFRAPRQAIPRHRAEQLSEPAVRA